MADSNPSKGAPFPTGPFLLKKGLTTVLCIACPLKHKEGKYQVPLVCQFCGSLENPLAYNTFYPQHHCPSTRKCDKEGRPEPKEDNLPTVFDPAKYEGWQHIPISAVGGWSPCVVPTAASLPSHSTSPLFSDEDDSPAKRPAVDNSSVKHPAVLEPVNPPKKQKVAHRAVRGDSFCRSFCWLAQSTEEEILP